MVGGHCIGVDPYYLTFKAHELGYQAEVILAGRRTNDNMGKFVAEVCIKQILNRNCVTKNARVGILGFTFKENVPDLRNTKVIDIVRELAEYNVHSIVHDPLIPSENAVREYGLALHPLDEFKDLDVVILAVPHDNYRNLKPRDLLAWFKDPDNAILLDLKGFWPISEVKEAGIISWRL